MVCPSDMHDSNLKAVCEVTHAISKCILEALHCTKGARISKRTLNAHNRRHFEHVVPAAYHGIESTSSGRFQTRLFVLHFFYSAIWQTGEHGYDWPATTSRSGGHVCSPMSHVHSDSLGSVDTHCSRIHICRRRHHVVISKTCRI
jgi:hypothetical protein